MYDRSLDTNALARDTREGLRFSASLTFTGISVHAGAKALARAFGSKVRRADGPAVVYLVDTDAGTWATTETSTPGATGPGIGDLVSPPMLFADRARLHAAAAALRDAGAILNDACGLAVGVDARTFNVSRVLALLTMAANSRELLRLAVGDRRRWVADTSDELLADLRAAVNAGDEVRAEAVIASIPRLSVVTYVRGIATYRGAAASFSPDDLDDAVLVALGLVARASVLAAGGRRAAWEGYSDGAKLTAMRYWLVKHGLMGAECAGTRARFRARVVAVHPFDYAARQPRDAHAA